MADFGRTFIYLGNRPDADPIEATPGGPSGYGRENPNAVLGSTTSPKLVNVTLEDRSSLSTSGDPPEPKPNGFIEENTIHDNTNGSIANYETNDTVDYTRPDGTVVSNTQVDSWGQANVTATLADGSTVSYRVGLIQMTNGDVFLYPFEANHPLSGMKVNGQRVTSINVDSVEYAFYGGVIPLGFTCFLQGTLIETDRGAVPIEDLCVGDLVQTAGDGLQEIRWIGSQRLTPTMLAQSPKLRPIRIQAGALGDGVPATDLLVSPQHRVLVRSRIAARMFAANEVLVAAKQLLLVDGIDIADDLDEFTYFHFMFDDHQVVISNGAETESLFTGPEGLKSVGPAAQAEIFQIFPELMDRDYAPVSARVLASGRMARRMAHRHVQNNKALVN